MRSSSEIRSLLNPQAPEFYPQNLVDFLPNITHNHRYNDHYYNPNSHPLIFFPPPPPPPQILIPTSHHHDQTAVVLHDHHQGHEHFSQARNYHNRRSRYFGRRGRLRGFSNPRTSRLIRASVNHNERSVGVSTSRQMRQVLIQGDLNVTQHSSSELLPSMHGHNATTLMIRNVPSKYTRQMLLDFLDQHCLLHNERVLNKNATGEDDQNPISSFDFLYLPMDFRTELNKGYAFVNFTSPEAASKFSEATDGQTWDHFRSSKIRKIARARLQGKDELKRHFENIAFPCGNEEFLPVLFIPPRDGTNKESVTQTTIGKLIGKKRRE